jgi:ABC-type uncharacterized transport system substrate-binding protein
VRYTTRSRWTCEQATKVELVINLRAAKVLGISFPLSLLGHADEVIA